MKSKVLRLGLALLFVVVFAQVSSSLPTPRNQKVSWDHSGLDTDLAGFFVYFAGQNETPPRSFTDANRFKVSDPLAREAFILDLNPVASGGLCFQLTAFDTSGNESGFGLFPIGKTEACGWFGMEGVTGLGVS